MSPYQSLKEMTPARHAATLRRNKKTRQVATSAVDSHPVSYQEWGSGRDG